MKILIPVITLAIGAIVTACLYAYFGQRLKKLRQSSSQDDLADKVVSGHRVTDSSLSATQRGHLATDLTRFQQRRTLWMGLSFTALSTVVATLSTNSLLNNTESPAVLVVTASGESKPYPIPGDGLSLQGVAVEADYVRRSESANENEETWFVSLNRRSDNDRTEAFYFPLDFVLNGPGQQVQLLANDRVSLTNLVDTDLGVLTTTEPGLEFSVTGKISKPGTYRTVETSEVMMNVASPEYAGTFEVGAEGPDILIVSRLLDEQINEHYVIPLRQRFVDVFLLKSRLRQNDKLTYGSLADLPF